MRCQVGVVDLGRRVMVEGRRGRCAARRRKCRACSFRNPLLSDDEGQVRRAQAKVKSSSAGQRSASQGTAGIATAARLHSAGRCCTNGKPHSQTTP